MLEILEKLAELNAIDEGRTLHLRIWDDGSGSLMRLDETTLESFSDIDHLMQIFETQLTEID